jgi:hypothetical protein
MSGPIIIMLDNIVYVIGNDYTVKSVLDFTFHISKECVTSISNLATTTVGGIVGIIAATGAAVASTCPGEMMELAPSCASDTLELSSLSYAKPTGLSWLFPGKAVQAMILTDPHSYNISTNFEVYHS